MTGISICNHFNFTGLPFIKPTRSPFNHATFNRDSSLLQTVFFSRQIATVTGISGSGKTSLVKYSFHELEPSSHRIVSCELSNPRKKALYKNIAVKCGIEAAFVSDDIKLQLIEFFNGENRQGKLNCLIVDEAHSLSIPILEELRSFYEEASNFSLILIGLPSLYTDILELSVNLPFKRRVSLSITTENLELLQTKDYIIHNLASINSKNPIFDEKCFPLIHGATKGIPGKINQLCYFSLIEAFKNNVAFVTEKEVRTCIEIINSP
jgi:type II secretory pathway predicted ATPase ExeA